MKATLFRTTLFALLLVSTGLYAGKSKVGTTAYSFLKLGAGAKALSMGGAFCGLADDESSLHYNPAGIVGFRTKTLAASYMNYVADIQSGNLYVIYPSADSAAVTSTEYEETAINDAKSALALSVSYLNYGSFDQTDQTGEVLGEFSGSAMAFGLSFARKMTPQLALGGTAKFIYEKVDQYSSTGIAADLGILFRMKDGRTNLGLSAANLGVQLSGLSAEHKDPLPIVFRAGVSHRVRELPLTVSVEGALPTDNDLFGSIGVELHPAKLPLAFRAGYSSFGRNYKTGGDKDGTAGLSFGAGFFLKQIVVDYAFVPYADLGSLHKVGFAYHW